MKNKLRVEDLRQGDFVFTSCLFPMGLLTKIFVGGRATHVGQLIDKYGNGKLYMAEMIGDFKKDNDLEINSLKKKFGRGLFKPRIVEVKRSSAYDLRTQKIFRERAVKQKASYDFGECLALAFNAPKLNRKGLICSGWCYENGKADGVLWSKKITGLPFAPSPEELRKERYLTTIYRS